LEKGNPGKELTFQGVKNFWFGKCPLRNFKGKKARKLEKGTGLNYKDPCPGKTLFRWGNTCPKRKALLE